jgi:ATP-binding cassette subfamily B (MDR/TAP) protein 1
MALIGRSGSGKSTIISLLQRFYEPDCGSVLLDGVDIRCLDLCWLRQQVRPAGCATATVHDVHGHQAMQRTL